MSLSDLKVTCSKLARLAFLSNVERRYIAGNPEKYFLKEISEHLAFLKILLHDSDYTEIFVTFIKNASLLVPRRVTLFYILSYALIHADGPQAHLIRHLILTAFLAICKSDEELFKFISIYTKMTPHKNKVTSALGKAAGKYFKKKQYKKFLTDVGKAKGYHGWEYKDVFKLSHYRGHSREKLLITNYVLRGLGSFKNEESTEAKEIYEMLEKFERLRKTDDEDEASVLVTELHANFSQVNSKFIKSQKVWSSIIPELTVREVLRLLSKLNKNGLLEANSKVHAGVIEAVTSESKIALCELKPLEVFIHLKDFEKGGKPLDPKLEHFLKSKSDDYKAKMEKIRSQPKCPIITSSLGECLKICYEKLFNGYVSSEKNILLALDVSQDTELKCFKNKNITCLEAQLFLALYYSKMEKNVDVIVYQNDQYVDFDLDQNVPFDENLQKLKDIKSEYVEMPIAIEWSMEREHKVDLFICFIKSGRSLCCPSKEDKYLTWDFLKKSFRLYRSGLSPRSIKLVVICLGSHKLPRYEDIEGGLLIHGLCPEIPDIIRSFAEGFHK